MRYKNIQKSSIRILTFSLLLFLGSCGPTEMDLPGPIGFDESLLLNCWKHSYEENVLYIEDVFRNCDYSSTWPASWYRSEFELFGNDSCQFLALAANDAHSFISATWTFDGDSTLTIVVAEDIVLFEKTILTLEEDKLIFKK